MAAARDKVPMLPAGSLLQSWEQRVSNYQVPAPGNDALNLPLDRGLQQNNTTNFSTLSTDVRDFAVDLPMQYPFQPRALSGQAIIFQGDEARSRDRKALQEQERMVCLLGEFREE